MAEESSELEGPDFEKGIETEKLAGGKMLLGHAFGEAVLVARRGDEFLAIAATCTHYGGPLAKGLMVDCTVHCPWHHARFAMKPGITGLWQVSSRRDPDFDHWVELDLEYIRSWSPELDLRIMSRTIPAVLRSEGR